MTAIGASSYRLRSLGVAVVVLLSTLVSGLPPMSMVWPESQTVCADVAVTVAVNPDHTPTAHLIFKAAADPSKIFIKNKHLADFGGNFAKFNSTDISEVQRWVAEGLRSDRGVFLPNKDGSFQIVVNMGHQVGTKGQMGIRIMVDLKEMYSMHFQ